MRAEEGCEGIWMMASLLGVFEGDEPVRGVAAEAVRPVALVAGVSDIGIGSILDRI